MSNLTPEQERRLAKLDALEAGGVENWEWYGESLADWFKENELHELADDFADELNDILVESEVDQPAGVGCGYAIHPPEGEIEALFVRYAKKLRGES